MKTNEEKCHLIVSTNDLNEIQIGNFSIKNSGKLLGVNTNSELNFDCHVKHLCNKANKKIKGTCYSCTVYDFRKKENCEEFIF